jgi:hypothetical protein
VYNDLSAYRAEEIIIMQGNVPAANLFSLGVDLFGQVQRTIGSDRVRALRLKLGNRVIKEFPVGTMTAAATVAVVLVAVVVSTLSIEVDHEPAH